MNLPDYWSGLDYQQLLMLQGLFWTALILSRVSTHCYLVSSKSSYLKPSNYIKFWYESYGCSASNIIWELMTSRSNRYFKSI